LSSIQFHFQFTSSPFFALVSQPELWRAWFSLSQFHVYCYSGVKEHFLLLPMPLVRPLSSATASVNYDTTLTNGHSNGSERPHRCCVTPLLCGIGCVKRGREWTNRLSKGVLGTCPQCASYRKKRDRGPMTFCL